MKKTPRSIDITAMDYETRRAARATVQRARTNVLWGPSAKATSREYSIDTKLRMLRCLQLQSAFLAKGGTLL